MKYAINIADLTMIPTIISQGLLAPFTVNRIIVLAEGKSDPTGRAVVLECGENRALAIINIIRAKHHKNKLRAYCLSNNLKNAKRV